MWTFLFDGFLVAKGSTDRSEEKERKEAANHEMMMAMRRQKSHGSEEKAEVNVCTVRQLVDWVKEGSKSNQRDEKEIEKEKREKNERKRLKERQMKATRW